jgi:hypothetical protein
MPKYIKFSLVFLVLAVVATVGLVAKIELSPSEQAPQINIENSADASSCRQDSDCVVSPIYGTEEPCCWNCGWEALNKEIYKTKQDSRIKTCPLGSDQKCSKMCKGYVESWMHAKCDNKKCEVYLKRPK